VREGRVRWALERLREQKALIEEARRRARRRRQRYAALVLAGLAIFVLVGFTGVSAGHPRDLSATFAPSATGAASARNGMVAFADDLGWLHVVAPDGTGSRVLARCPPASHGRSQRTVPPRSICRLVGPAWSADGRRIAFIRGDLGLLRSMRGDSSVLRSTFSLSFSLYLRDPDGSVRRLTGCGSCASQHGGRLSWSPDGSRIAFSRDDAPRGTLSLWTVDTAGGKLRRLTDCRPKLCADVDPDWSPSGELIVFSRGGSLYTVRADGSQLTKITNSAVAENPRWSPDGRKIAYDGLDEISIVDADGSDEKLLLDEMGGGSGPGVPSWSPDGTKLAFFNTPGRSGGYTAEVWTITTDGSARQRLYHSACCVMSWAAPIWSPDGNQIAFAASSADGTFVIGSDGTGLRRLSTASANGITWQRLP
jgi:Tol biopolymer transport system component